ncbi:MAG TPA: fused MFS/spermidine synthase [Casimicrobiaceae bacterium]|nr:fused MFS/spermidine synthase [Casimicrobiaceae bacterium]
MLLSALTIFASAFLLFLLQPIIAKQILPWFGGSAAVWTTCLVFFQSVLTAGYAYADVVVRKLGPRTQMRLHVALLAASLVVLPIVPAVHWKPEGGENPAWLILGLLAATIGLPYFLLSTTSPLVQAWFARRYPGRSPYRLFALSNLASMLALLGYPFLLEPWIATRRQALGWSAGYVVFALLCALAAYRLGARPMAAAAPAVAGAPERDGPPPPAARQLLWCALAATGSVLLLAVSNHITQNVAAVPLLWLMPLALYLLTFVLCFEGSGWYRRDVFLSAAAAALGVMAWALADTRLTHELGLQLGAFATGLFLACMFCHGELAQLKPAPRYLTRFYLMVSLGGAVGAALVGIVAPLVLPAQFELPLGLAACALLLLWQTRRAPVALLALGVAASIATAACGIWYVRGFYDGVIATARNFYGVLRVQESALDEQSRHRSLIHGTIMHGNQYLFDDLRRKPTSYYTPTSGIGRVLESLNPRLAPLKVGVIGLGTGTIAAYGARGDTYRFYDINPAVVRLARERFTYLGDSEATIDTPLGDARLSLEREPPQQFDVLAIDAFSSDAIPVHLITVEALDVYRRHMKPDGVIAFHVTNRYLDLVPVVEALGRARNMRAVWIDDAPDDPMASRSDWVLLTSGGDVLDRPRIAEAAAPIKAHPEWALWTDDFNNLFQVLKR